jgi:hypothetical protein
VPLNVVGKHAKKTMTPDAFISFVVDGSHFKLDTLEISESLFHQHEFFVGSDYLLLVHKLNRNIRVYLPVA